MNRRRAYKPNRHGSMLIELCGSLAAGSMIMLLGITLIERSMHWTQSMQRQTNLQRQLGQLANTWREDFSNSQAAEFQSENRVVLQAADIEILYESKGDRVLRRLTSKDPQSNRPADPETFVLGDGFKATFESPYLIVRATNPAGEVISTRLRVFGKTSGKNYRTLEDLP
ncbi:MAG: hypothetical protein ACKN9S_08310 [Pirellula sp.]